MLFTWVIWLITIEPWHIKLSKQFESTSKLIMIIYTIVTSNNHINVIKVLLNDLRAKLQINANIWILTSINAIWFNIFNNGHQECSIKKS